MIGGASSSNKSSLVRAIDSNFKPASAYDVPSIGMLSLSSCSLFIPADGALADDIVLAAAAFEHEMEVSAAAATAATRDTSAPVPVLSQRDTLVQGECVRLYFVLVPLPRFDAAAPHVAQLLESLSVQIALETAESFNSASPGAVFQQAPHVSAQGSVHASLPPRSADTPSPHYYVSSNGTILFPLDFTVSVKPAYLDVPLILSARLMSTPLALFGTLPVVTEAVLHPNTCAASRSLPQTRDVLRPIRVVEPFRVQTRVVSPVGAGAGVSLLVASVESVTKQYPVTLVDGCVRVTGCEETQRAALEAMDTIRTQFLVPPQDECVNPDSPQQKGLFPLSLLPEKVLEMVVRVDVMPDLATATVLKSRSLSLALLLSWSVPCARGVLQTVHRFPVLQLPDFENVHVAVSFPDKPIVTHVPFDVIFSVTNPSPSTRLLELSFQDDADLVRSNMDVIGVTPGAAKASVLAQGTADNLTKSSVSSARRQRSSSALPTRSASSQELESVSCITATDQSIPACAPTNQQHAPMLSCLKRVVNVGDVPPNTTVSVAVPFLCTRVGTYTLGTIFLTDKSSSSMLSLRGPEKDRNGPRRYVLNEPVLVVCSKQ